MPHPVQGTAAFQPFITSVPPRSGLFEAQVSSSHKRASLVPHAWSCHVSLFMRQLCTAPWHSALWRLSAATDPSWPCHLTSCSASHRFEYALLQGFLTC